jgi:hypothetical protein
MKKQQTKYFKNKTFSLSLILVYGITLISLFGIVTTNTEIENEFNLPKKFENCRLYEIVKDLEKVLEVEESRIEQMIKNLKEILTNIDNQENLDFLNRLDNFNHLN